MKNKKNLLSLLLCSLSFNLIYSMEKLANSSTNKLVSNSKEEEKQDTQFQEELCLDNLSGEIKLLILESINIDDIIDKSNNVTELFKNLNAYKINRTFASLMHTKSFIKSVMKQYLNKKSEEKIKDEFRLAFINSNAFVIKAFILGGINPNIKLDFGETALMICEDIEILKILLNAGSDPNIKEGFGDTALMQAMKLISIKKVKLLLQANANPNLQNDLGQTALMIGASSYYTNSISSIEALLQTNANPNIKNNRGNTALILAIHFNQIAIFKLLLQEGADIGNSFNTINYYRKRLKDAKLRQIKHIAYTYYDLFLKAKTSSDEAESRELLTQAIQEGYSAIVKILLKKQVPINFDDLKLAKDNNHITIGRILINHLGLMTEVSGISKLGLGLPKELSDLIGSFLYD